MYRKSYTGFIVWLIVFCGAMFSLAFLPVNDPASVTRLLMNLCTVGVAQLAWMIWHNERVYWYTGVSFEEAEKAGSERRKAYAWRHFRLFGGFALVSLALSMGAHLAGLPWWVDFTLITFGLIAAALRTMVYHL